jgi:hypothetical protein
MSTPSNRADRRQENTSHPADLARHIGGPPVRLPASAGPGGDPNTGFVMRTQPLRALADLTTARPDVLDRMEPWPAGLRCPIVR